MGWFRRRREAAYDERAARAERSKGDVRLAGLFTPTCDDPTPPEPLTDWDRENLVREAIANGEDDHLMWFLRLVDGRLADLRSLLAHTRIERDEAVAELRHQVEVAERASAMRRMAEIAERGRLAELDHRAELAEQVRDAQANKIADLLARVDELIEQKVHDARDRQKRVDEPTRPAPDDGGAT